ncbi:MAG TPA: hypothetical protein PK208_05410 [Fibrobacteria bacterium]|nr:hypothetical protein [Fibrobacteria bacterium]
MPSSPGNPHAGGVSRPVAGVDAPRRGRTSDEEMAALYYQGFLDDMAAAHDGRKLVKFVKDVFETNQTRLSQRALDGLARFLVDWTARQHRDIRTVVWLAFNSCGWTKAMLDLSQELTAAERRTLLDIHPVIRCEVLEPWLTDMPKAKPGGEGKEQKPRGRFRRNARGENDLE